MFTQQSMFNFTYKVRLDNGIRNIMSNAVEIKDNLNHDAEKEIDNAQYKVQFDKASEILDLCCMQLDAISSDIDNSTFNLTEMLTALSQNVDAIKKKDSDDIKNEQSTIKEHCLSAEKNIRELIIAYQANDEFCQRISHLHNTIGMLGLLIRSTLLRELPSEWEELYNNILSNRSIQRQHEVFQAAVSGESFTQVSSDTEDDDSYELF